MAILALAFAAAAAVAPLTSAEPVIDSQPATASQAASVEFLNWSFNDALAEPVALTLAGDLFAEGQVAPRPSLFAVQGGAVFGGRAAIDADAFLSRLDPIGAARWTPTARFGPFEFAASSRANRTSRQGRGDLAQSGWSGGVRFFSRPRSADVLERWGIDDGGEAAAAGWYLFAGADEQALQWRSGEGAGLRGVALLDQIIVGDAQAGVGWRVGRADVAVGLIHREVKYNDAKTEEQFGGFTVVMRH